MKLMTAWQATSTFNAELTASDGRTGDALEYFRLGPHDEVVASANQATVMNRQQGAAYVFGP